MTWNPNRGDASEPETDLPPRAVTQEEHRRQRAQQGIPIPTESSTRWMMAAIEGRVMAEPARASAVGTIEEAPAAVSAAEPGSATSATGTMDGSNSEDEQSSSEDEQQVCENCGVEGASACETCFSCVCLLRLRWKA